MPFTDQRMADHAASFDEKPAPKFGAGHLEADIAELKNRVAAIETFLSQSTDAPGQPAEPPVAPAS